MLSTPPLLTETCAIGLVTRIGLKENLQPNDRNESLKKLTVMIGLLNNWGGSMCETMQPPGR